MRIYFDGLQESYSTEIGQTVTRQVQRDQGMVDSKTIAKVVNSGSIHETALEAQIDYLFGGVLHQSFQIHHGGRCDERIVKFQRHKLGIGL